MSKKILIIGGRGRLGRPVLDRLIIDGYSPVVMTHNKEKADQFFGGLIPVVEGDVTDPESLKKPFEGIEAIYINLSARYNIKDYINLEANGCSNIAKIAKEQGVGQLAMISGLSASTGETKYPFINGKILAEKALMESGIPYTIMRCCWFFESLPLFVTGKQATVFGKQKNKFSWIAAADYTPMVSKIFELESARNRIFHIRGIEKYSLYEALSKYCEICYPDAKMVRLPIWIVATISKLSRKGAMSGIVQFMKYFDRHEEPDIQDDSEQILGPALTTLTDWAENYKIQIMSE